MTTYRMLPPLAPSAQTVTVNSNVYSAAPGTAVDALAADAAGLAAAGWIQVAQSGPTGSRPSAALVAPLSGLAQSPSTAPRYFDTTLGKLIFGDGSVWRDAATGKVV